MLLFETFICLVLDLAETSCTEEAVKSPSLRLWLLLYQYCLILALLSEHVEYGIDRFGRLRDTKIFCWKRSCNYNLMTSTPKLLYMRHDEPYMNDQIAHPWFVSPPSPRCTSWFQTRMPPGEAEGASLRKSCRRGPTCLEDRP